MSSPKTIRVRIAVAVTANGCWSADGCKLNTDWSIPTADDSHGSYLFGKHGPGHVVFVEADVPVPDPSAAPVIEGTVVA